MHGLRQDTTVISVAAHPPHRLGQRPALRKHAAFTTRPWVRSCRASPSRPTSFSRHAMGPSCDWLLADKIGMATRFPSLVYRVQAADAQRLRHRQHLLSATASGCAIVPWRRPCATIRSISPRVAFDRLFTGFTPPTAGHRPSAPRPGSASSGRTSSPGCRRPTPDSSRSWAPPTGTSSISTSTTSTPSSSG